MATTKITSPELFDLGSLNTALQLPSGTTAERPTSPSTGEWRYNTDNNLIEFYDGADWRGLQDEDFPPVPSENFNAVLYTGTGSTQSITGVGFQPDLVWMKNRSSAANHVLVDSNRGRDGVLYSNSTSQEAPSPAGTDLASFDSDGFTLGTNNNGNVNTNGDTYVAWCWKADGGNNTTNTDGTITSTVQVNSDAGFSIVKHTNSGSTSSTVGHGLGVAPKLYITKKYTTTTSWWVYTTVIDGSMDQIKLNGTDAKINASINAPTSSVFYNQSGTSDGAEYITYAFAEVAGFSKFGSYTGTSADGNIVETGFEPAFIIIKKTSAASGSWWMLDNKRNTTNPRDSRLVADQNFSESTSTSGNVNFLTNGFELLGNYQGTNETGQTYIYMAFAADPSSEPTLADSFNTTTYTGTGTSNSITGLNFSPSLVWLKQRDTSRGQNWYDVIRGAENLILSNGTSAASQEPAGTTLGSFDTDGFTVGTGNGVNQSGGDYVSWNWKGSTLPTINTDGTTQSLVSANPAAGFSIVKYEGNATSGATIGHGLSAAPEMIIIKNLDGVYGWKIGHTDIGWTKYLEFDTGAAATSSGVWNDTAPTSTTFTLGSINSVNGSAQNYIAYCFHSVSGFSKFGSYAGNGTSQSVTLGFEPTFLMLRKYDDVQDWFMLDSVRDPSNPKSKRLFANLSSAEVSSSTTISFTSTGFDLPSATFNDSGKNFIYIAFKENPTLQPAAGYMSYLVVAGGGPGQSGGGGAGGLRTSYGSTSGGGASAESDIALAAGTYTVTIGAGGAKGASGTKGSDSVFSTVTSAGGGQGGKQSLDNSSISNGGCGGGQGRNDQAGPYTGTANQGFDGGQDAASTFEAGGGGGTGQVGQDGVSGGAAGNGGNGTAVSITGASVTYGGGGGGTGESATASGTGGTGGGGNGSATTGSAGTVNTGGGGGGGVNLSNYGDGGAGGSGVVILRLATSEYSGTTTGSPTVTTDGDYTILTYTGSGTYVHS